MRLFRALQLATFLIAAPAAPMAQDAPPLFSIRSGETLPLKTVSWMASNSCAQLFQKLDSVDVLEPIEGITLRTETGKYQMTWKGCPSGMLLDGIRILATAAPVAHKIEGIMTYRISMDAIGGPVQVTYRAQVIIYPAK